MKPRIGLALGSGGARGWCHIGVMRALAEEGITPDVICGTSMGALVGAAACSGALDKLEAFARNLTQLSVARMVDIDVTSGGLITGDRIVQALQGLGYGERIEALDRPFMAVATDLYAGREVWLQDGPLLPAIRASIGIPGIFAPYHKDGRWLLDGGMSNPIPVSCARALGADVVIAVDPNSKLYSIRRDAPQPQTPGFGLDQVVDTLPAAVQPLLRSYLSDKTRKRQRPPAYLDVLSTSIDVMTDHIRRARLAGEPPHVMVNLTLMDKMTVLDFTKADLAIREGYEAMKAQMPGLQAILS
ncbi:patatin [Thalassobius vesicularis]|uniref:Patatin n=1 Tax=Thalassobius vesicularis TaxID=1294297 RepID=A0A4S3MC07_9RHOB|nr:patatin-like phospholipase family protein [Thalassobius vesicularis]THD74895.1 patatin [Thalassobius vesicularis]